MKLLLLTLIMGAIVLISTLIVVALYRHKKASVGKVQLLGEIGRTSSSLDPEGSVVVRGELWQARSRNGDVIPKNFKIRVIGTTDHLLLVEQCD